MSIFETEDYQERYALAKERISEIADQNEMDAVWGDYFLRNGSLLLRLCQIYEGVKAECISDGEYRLLNQKVYEDILPENYEHSFCNPTYCVQKFAGLLVEKPDEANVGGQLLAAYSAEFRGAIGASYRGELLPLLIRMELFLGLFSLVRDALTENRQPEVTYLREQLYWYVSDYAEDMSEIRVAEMVDPALDFASKIIEGNDLSKTDYLYKYGAYITRTEEEIATFIASMEEEKVECIASTFSEGYRIGFELTGKDLSKKTTVNVRYPLGFERIIKASMKKFEDMGLKNVLYASEHSLFRKYMASPVGYFGAIPNKQFIDDHKEDDALLLDGQLVTRKLECLEKAFETYKEQARGHAGPAVMELFGEEPFSPITCQEKPAYSDEQQKLTVRLAGKSGQLTNTYIPGEERSFTIIAFPSPAIGKDFAEIFAETVKINTLDYMKYRQIQQTMIDALDAAAAVHLKGADGNDTDITVSLIETKDAAKETKFENCVADVNIPVGEVFTSPVLKGTTGTIHVSRVFLNELEYKNLHVHLVDGFVSSYALSNFDDEAVCQKYFKDNVLYHHDTLPVGEFAIGTNTAAYVMARKYGIESRLPILIAEKTGPHFALGDTCYSHAEDVKVYNPDGKEIIARDNEVSSRRKDDPENAYYNCHTDITIPYDELAYIDAVHADGSSVRILENGRFVLPGTEALNDAFNEE
ncbi:MAG: aminopeptidase [Lachnospiraceae bacterium]|nr:aminopeptidase [Lachnospiraceae bacterium]